MDKILTNLDYIMKQTRNLKMRQTLKIIFKLLHINFVFEFPLYLTWQQLDCKNSLDHIVEGFYIRIISKFQIVDTSPCNNRGDLSQVSTVMGSNSSLSVGVLRGIGNKHSWLDHTEICCEKRKDLCKELINNYWMRSLCIWNNQVRGKCYQPSRRPRLIIGTLRSNDADGNENVKKTIGLISKTTTLHVHHAFLYISLPVFARLRREHA